MRDSLPRLAPLFRTRVPYMDKLVTGPAGRGVVSIDVPLEAEGLSRKHARLFRDETDINVWRALIGAFNYLDMIATEVQRPA